MGVKIKPIESVSLKDACIEKLEGLILSGAFEAGVRLPSERDLAAQLGVSRPVLHQAIVALDAKGLVQIEARRGVFVCDYLREGSIPLYTVLMAHSDGAYMPGLLNSLMAARILIETETARLAAQHRSEIALFELQALLSEGQQLVAGENAPALVAYDFTFHQSVAIASTNLMYPLMINSLKNVHANLAGIFYRAFADSPVSEEVLAFHADLVDAIQAQDNQWAAETMKAMLEHGEQHLLSLLSQD
jgi:GntR family transcriptional repressor for pyruvate dehydrogenase complex